MTFPDPSAPSWTRSLDAHETMPDASGGSPRSTPPPSARTMPPPAATPSAATSSKRPSVTSVSVTELAYRHGFMAFSMVLVVILLVAALLISGWFTVRMLMLWGWRVEFAVLGTITISVFQYYLWRNHQVIMSLPTTRSSRWLFAGFILALSFASTAFSVYASWDGLIAFGLDRLVSLPIALFVDLAPEPLLVPAVSVFVHLLRDWMTMLKRIRASR